LIKPLFQNSKVGERILSSYSIVWILGCFEWGKAGGMFKSDFVLEELSDFETLALEGLGPRHLFFFASIRQSD
jgi:hypothetical protein